MNKIRLSKSVVGEEEKQALARAIDVGYLGMGAEVQQFEEDIRDFLGTDHEVLCVNTGTAALHLSLQALGLGPGDEVLVPSLTYVATFQAISATGAKPVACDVTRNKAFIDLIDAEKRLSKFTKAIIPVHYGSNSEGMEDVHRFANRHGLRVIEDAAHSFGCTRNGRRIGAEGDITCFSFDGIKNITAGEGGAVVTGDKAVAQRIKDARLLGVEKDTEKRYAGQRSWSFDVKDQGWRYHMSNLMAAIGREQLKKIEFFSERRQLLANRYVSELRGIPNLTLLDFDYQNLAPHIFPIIVGGGHSSALAAALADDGIETGTHYQPNHLLTYYATEYPLPVTEELAQQLLSIPLHPDVGDEDQSRVIHEIRQFLTGC
jgi:dTDP-4-amino-4,6-dideoxygalactose transaminase